MKIVFFYLVLFGGALVYFGDFWEVDVHEHPKPSTGKEYFAVHCVACHKANGAGKFLKGVPANMKTDKDITEIISHIQKSSRVDPPGYGEKMPSFTEMPQEEARAIAEHLLYLKAEWKRKNPEVDWK